MISGKGGGGAIASWLVALSLVFQLVLAAPCTAQVRPATPAAHCEEAASVETSDPAKAPGGAADACNKCVAIAVAQPLAPHEVAGPGMFSIRPADLSPTCDPPVLRAIASGPPSQAPPALV